MYFPFSVSLYITYHWQIGIAQLVPQLGYGLDGLGFKFWQEQEIFLFSKASRTNSAVHPKPHNKWVPRFFPRGNAAKA
jgi:hypothetical protein